uniref:Uncharacterized protein n=1 Tax=Glossina palpalis gambiensis TaxID=67801 RepID=A0A1B0BR27_9MUSC
MTGALEAKTYKKRNVVLPLRVTSVVMLPAVTSCAVGIFQICSKLLQKIRLMAAMPQIRELLQEINGISEECSQIDEGSQSDIDELSEFPEKMQKTLLTRTIISRLSRVDLINIE